MSNEHPVSRGELVDLSQRIDTIRFGCSLLERKKEALLRAIEADRSTFFEMKRKVEEMLSFVSYSYALVRLFEGDSVMTLLSWGIEPRKIKIVHHSLMGCRYCQFYPQEGENSVALGGLLMDPALASLHVDELLQTLSKIEPILWRYVNLKAKLDALEVEFTKTRMKVNNLEQEMLPGMEKEKVRIRLGLSERERNESFAARRFLKRRRKQKAERSCSGEIPPQEVRH